MLLKKLKFMRRVDSLSQIGNPQKQPQNNTTKHPRRVKPTLSAHQRMHNLPQISSVLERTGRQECADDAKPYKYENAALVLILKRRSCLAGFFQRKVVHSKLILKAQLQSWSNAPNTPTTQSTLSRIYHIYSLTANLRACLDCLKIEKEVGGMKKWKTKWHPEKHCQETDVALLPINQNWDGTIASKTEMINGG